MSQTPALSAETLLRHEPFVRAVVRGLLSDESRIQDVVQETWLTALRRPPRAGASLRAWLARVARNLARDSHRGASRRSARERAVARPEAVESVAATHERLSAQREVVDVVLALGEPYRGVVLLRYYQDLDVAEIAQRLGRSPATVRSQLSRAREILRASLDSRFEGRRAAWASLLLPLAPEATVLEALGTICATTTARVTAGVLAAGVLAVMVVPRLREPTEPSSNAGPGVVAAVTGPVSTPAEFALAPAFVGPAASAREPAASEPGVALDLGVRARLESRSTQELLELAVQTQRAIERSLLTPDEELVAQHAALLSLPGTGICRILDGDGTESRFADAITRRGGGAYYSFATRDHSYEAEPDLSFHRGKFGAGFHGTQLGLLVEVGDVALTELPERGDSAPFWLPGEKREAWGLLWRDISLDDAAHDSSFRKSTEALRRSISPGGTGSTFLLRSFSPNEHDQLVAFRPLVLDDTGCTLAWRVLRTWPVPGDRAGPPDRRAEHLEVPQGPEWLDEASLEDLLEFLALVRGQARERLLQVPQVQRDRYASAVGQPATSFADRSGFARILHRGRWHPLVELRGGGAFYSFLTGSNDYDEESELKLEQERYSSGFAGRDEGFLLDLGEVRFDRLAGVMAGEVPAGLDQRLREAWDFLWSVRASAQESGQGGRRALSDADRRRADDLGLGGDVPALVGHTYLLRSVLFDSHDHLVAFTVIGVDEFGHSLAWRILRSWPVEPPPTTR